jgi:NADH dehydrogenase FAD-containing subunit
MMSMVPQKKVVIVGAGVAGLSVLSSITSNRLSQLATFNISLVEKKNFVESGIYSLRHMANPKEFDDSNSFLLMSDVQKMYQRNGNIVNMYSHSHAVKLNTELNQITIKREDENDKMEHVLDYDYLVLANGCSYKSPYIKPDINAPNVSPVSRLQEFREFYENINSEQNTHVLIVGGGSLGVELAGEVVDLNNQRIQNGQVPFKISVVHSRTLLRNRSNSESAHNYIKDFLEQNGANVYMGRRAYIQHPEDSTDFSVEINPAIKKNVVLRGANLEDVELTDVSMVFWCGSMKPNTEWMNGSGVELDATGAIRVLNSLQSNIRNVFAIGDVNDVPIEKLAGSGSREGVMTSFNVVSMAINGSDTSKLVTLKSKAQSEFSKFKLSLGVNDGIIGHKDEIKLSGAPAGLTITKGAKGKLLKFMRDPETFEKRHEETFEKCLKQIAL